MFHIHRKISFYYHISFADSAQLIYCMIHATWHQQRLKTCVPESCVETYRSSHSDPSSWGGCAVCRPSCHTQIFDVVLSQGPLRATVSFPSNSLRNRLNSSDITALDRQIRLRAICSIEIRYGIKRIVIISTSTICSNFRRNACYVSAMLCSF